MNVDHFECLFCNSKFVTETKYLKHHCKQMERAQTLKSPAGQAAYSFYQKWMRFNNRMIPSIDQFAVSKLFRSFIKFAHFAHTHHLPDNDLYINLMVEKDIPPTIWTTDEIYRLYLEFLERKTTAEQQAKITIRTLYQLSKNQNCDVRDVFNHLSHSEVISLLKQRRLSPWLLLFSNKFMAFLGTCTPEQKIFYESIIKPSFWQTRFDKFRAETEKMKEYIEELEL